MRKTDVDLVRRAASCVSSNKESRSEIHHLYKVSAKVTACLHNVANQATQLKSDIRVSMTTRSGCERVVKSESHKEVTQELVHKRQVMSIMSDCEKVVKSELYKEVIMNLMHKSHWREAINKELTDLWEHCVWTIELLSEEWKVVECKWVFKVKNDKNR